MNPVAGSKEYDSWEECGMTGYVSSINLLKSMGSEYINTKKIYIAFTCKEITSL